jgi:hypothetical protein
MTVLSSPVQYVASTPPVTRAFAAATVVLSLLYYWVSWSSERPICGPVPNPGAWNEHILSLVLPHSGSGGDHPDRGV